MGFINSAFPLRYSVKYIEARYDKSITNFFIFFRFLVTLNIITLFGFLYLMLAHMIKYSAELAYICN